MTSLSRPELLCPAGTLKAMRYAFAYGADAVYAGQPRYSLRVRNNEFDHANLALGIARRTPPASASTWWSTSRRITPSCAPSSTTCGRWWRWAPTR